MFHWIAIHFLIHYLPFNFFAVCCSFPISRALNTAEAAYEWSLFSVLCLQLYILAETVCPRISLGASSQLIRRLYLSIYYFQSPFLTSSTSFRSEAWPLTTILFMTKMCGYHYNHTLFTWFIFFFICHAQAETLQRAKILSRNIQTVWFYFMLSGNMAE